MRLKKLTPDSPILKAVLIFFVGLPVLKDYYSYSLTFAALKLLAGLKDATVEGIVRKGDAFYITLKFLRGGESYSVIATLTSSVSRCYAFTVPLILSLLASLSFFIKRKKRAYAEALVILLLSHLLYVFFVEATIITEQSMLNGIEPVNITIFSIYQYAWKATEFAAMSIGPFIIAIYVYLRFKK